MYRKYQCVCRFCGNVFSSTNYTKDVCKRADCQKKNRNFLKIGSRPDFSINDVVKIASAYSRQYGKVVTYGQVSLLLEHGIKTF